MLFAPKSKNHTQECLSEQPIWHTEDLFKFFAMGLFIGFMVGLLF